MAHTLDDAYHRIIELLPEDWVIVSIVQDSGGWRISLGRKVFGVEQSWEPTIDSRAGSILKAMNRLIDRLENM